MASGSTDNRGSFPQTDDERRWSREEKGVVVRGLILAESVRAISAKLPGRHYGGVCTLVARMRKSGEMAILMDEEWAKLKPTTKEPVGIEKFFQPVLDNVRLPGGSQCSFPFGDLRQTGLVYCPAPKLRGMSYCVAHTILATDPADRAQRIERLVESHKINHAFAQALLARYEEKKATPAD